MQSISTQGGIVGRLLYCGRGGGRIIGKQGGVGG